MNAQATSPALSSRRAAGTRRRRMLTFEYDSGNFGRLTATATIAEDGKLKGDVKSSPDSDGYAWEATKKADAKDAGSK